MTEPETEPVTGPTTGPTTGHSRVDADTVEAVVRRQLASALGGRRGMVEAAVPTLAFTLTYVFSKELRLAIVLSIVLALALLVVRLVQRSSPKFVLNSLAGIGIGVLFVYLGKRNGGDVDQQALAYFLPGLIYNAGYSVLMVFTILVRWPLVGFMVGAVAEDPLEWHQDKQVVRLCTHLTWLLALPCVVRVVVQGPVYLAGRAAEDASGYVTALGLLKVAMGWPLQVAALAAMLWLLARDRTPVSTSAVGATGPG